MNISPAVMQIFQNKQLNMNQKMISLYMFTPSQQLPDVASLPDCSDLEKKIGDLINSGILEIHGFDKNGNLKYTLYDEV